MTAPHKEREIVIEFEKVQMIRRRARTIYKYCRGCGAEKDFVGVRAAAALFGITAEELHSFVSANAVHLAAVGTNTNSICIPSLLEVMRLKQDNNGPKLIAGQNSAVS